MFLFLLLCCGTEKTGVSKLHSFSTHRITIRETTWELDWACRPEEVALGLRYRKLASDEGMLLCASSGVVSMKKMKSPISVAFLTAQGEIHDIISLDLGAQDYPISSPTSFLWEMPMGWFTAHGIQQGMVVSNLPAPSEL